MKQYVKVDLKPKMLLYIFLKDYWLKFSAIPLGMITFLLLFSDHINVIDVHVFENCETTYTSGVLESVKKTDIVDQRRVLRRYIYRYEVQDVEYEGVSYGFNLPLRVGNRYVVEYIKTKPQLSVIDNTSPGYYSGEISACKVLLFPVLVLFLFGIKRTVQFYFRIKGGYLTTATLIKRKGTNMVDGVRYHKLEFEYIRRYSGTKETIELSISNPSNLLDDKEELILYNNKSSSKVHFVDRLPTQLRDYLSDEWKRKSSVLNTKYNSRGESLRTSE